MCWHRNTIHCTIAIVCLSCITKSHGNSILVKWDMPIPGHKLCRHRARRLLLATEVTEEGEANVWFASLGGTKVIAVVSSLTKRAKAGSY